MSITIGSLLVLLIGWLLNYFKISYISGEVEGFVNAVIQLIGFIGAWYGRYRLGGVNLLGKRT